MLQSRTTYFSLVGVAWSSTTINTVLTILETASFSASHNSLLQIAAASSALDAVSICCIGVYTFQTMRQRIASTDSPAQARILVGLNISLSGIALIVSLALICSIRSKWAEIMQASSKAPVADWTSHVGAQIAIWILSCISQIVLYSSPFWRKQAPKVQEATSAEPRDSVMSELRSPQRSRNLFSMEPTQPSSPLAAALPSPTFSSRSSHSLKSFRESLRHVVRPATSRTTLISRASFNRDARSIYSQSESFENVSHSDGFDSWDTSSVSLSARDVVMQSAPTRGRTLDPIPWKAHSLPNSQRKTRTCLTHRR
jgi:hypothetical protein